MMMRMLRAGGMPVLVDDIRTADPDNPNGYYEYERVKKVKEDRSWLPEAVGKAVKMVSALLTDLPAGYDYKVIFMRRAMPEILASQRQMLVRQGKPAGAVTDAQMGAMFEKHLAQIRAWLARQPNFEVVYVDYNQLLAVAAPHLEEINTLLGNTLDTEQMARVVNPDLYRQRA
jgi:hypothetical protein